MTDTPDKRGTMESMTFDDAKKWVGAMRKHSRENPSHTWEIADDPKGRTLGFRSVPPDDRRRVSAIRFSLPFQVFREASADLRAKMRTPADRVAFAQTL